MKIAIVFYSRSGFTEHVANALRDILVNTGFIVDTYRVLPLAEYMKPLHFNLRLIHDTLVRKGTSIRFDPVEPDLLKYDLVIVASPIWCNTLASPIQEFLKRYNADKPIVLITTSGLNIDYSKTARKTAYELAKVDPIYSVNIPVKTIRDQAELRRVIEEIAKHINNVTKVYMYNNHE